MTDSASPNGGLGFRGFLEPHDIGSDFSAQVSVIAAMISRISTATVVEVMGVTNDGGLSAVGFVDVKPLVKQMDGANNTYSHGTIYRCPYLRLQGGASAIIIDPVVGDIGIAVFADRDISSVAATGAEASPGSRRSYDMADGMYFGGILNGIPTQFIQYLADEAGITITTPGRFTVNAQDIVLHASRSYSADVYGYGTSTLLTSGLLGNYTVTSYTIGATINAIPANWTPPQPPEP